MCPFGDREREAGKDGEGEKEGCRKGAAKHSGCWRGTCTDVGSGLAFQCLTDPPGRAVLALSEGESSASQGQTAGSPVSPPPAPVTVPASCYSAWQEGAALSRSALEPGRIQGHLTQESRRES